MMLPANDFRMFWREETIRPDGEGNYNGTWIKNTDCSPGSLNTVVDETAQNGDTDFCLTDGLAGGPSCLQATGIAKQSFTLSNPAVITATDVILSVTTHNFARKTTGSVNTFRVGLREGAADVFAANVNLTTSYVDYSSKQITKPSGGAWTLATVNAAESIIESLVIPATDEQRVTQNYCVVEYVIMPAAAGEFPFRRPREGTTVRM